MNSLTDGPGGGIEPVATSQGSPQSAGTRLRLAREAAQLTIDDVAQQLKLARRQVIALENDDVNALPGPTFVRGFIRNYARFLRIDAAPLIEANRLAAAPTTPAAAIGTIAPTMSELPVNVPREGTGIARWLIPIGLVLLLAAGVGYYQFSGSSMAGKKSSRKDVSEPVATTVPAEPASTSADSPPASVVKAPVAEPSAATASLPVPVATSPATSNPTTSQRINAIPGSPASASNISPSAGTAPPSNTDSSTPNVTGQASTGAAEARLELEFVASSWVEVRDKHGDVLISRTMPAKSRQIVRGELPLTLRVGNASNVRVALDGRPVDLSPFTRNEIARLVLPSTRP